MLDICTRPRSFLCSLFNSCLACMGEWMINSITLQGDSPLTKVGSHFKDILSSEVVGKTSYCFITGYASGYCVRRVARVLAFAVGGVFLVTQTLSYYGYLKVDHDLIKEDLERRFDINNDGTIDGIDGQIVYNKFQDVLSYNMPAGSGFIGGLLMGLKV